MPKTLKPLIWALVIICPLLFSFVADLEYRDVLGGDLKILVPKDFIHVPKEAYKLAYDGDRAPDDFYCNQDTSESIGFVKFPKPVTDFSWGKQMAEAILHDATKVYYNDTTTINGHKGYLISFEGMDAGKPKYAQFFLISTQSSTILGGISCSIKLKDSWMPVSEKILRSIKVN
jgi:hypothetical protein